MALVQVLLGCHLWPAVIASFSWLLTSAWQRRWRLRSLWRLRFLVVEGCLGKQKTKKKMIVWP
uniref:Uncharacterized protein n=1 Tax=Physcomitrium patens TaxID=3218 RepID=A0A7I4C1Q3_PHYPA